MFQLRSSSLVLPLALVFFTLSSADAQTGTAATPSKAAAQADPEGQKVAQFDADDSYDPFADYSEFDQAQEEEEDVNFFRNGRMVTVGILAGYRGWTQELSNLYSGAGNYGLFLDYFFDLRFALQFAFTTGQNSFGFTAGNQPFTGSVSMQDFQLAIKYYLNTQNVTKGLAQFNPFILLGVSELFRTLNDPETSAYGKDNSTAFDIGGGIEMPFMKNKMFWGVEAFYQLTNFPDQNEPITTQTFPPPGGTGIYPHGDSYEVLGILGVNF